MNLWPIIGFVVVVSSSMQIGNQEDESKSLTCYICNGPVNDPFCLSPGQRQCSSGYVCYVIHLKSIGVTMGCSKAVSSPSIHKSEYCNRYSDQFDPFVSICYDCSSGDLCNGNTLMAAKLFLPLVAVGVLINLLK